MLSESEVQDATQLDEPVSTEGGRDTSAALLAKIRIERDQDAIRKLERAIARDTAELEAENDSWWQNYLSESLVQKRRRIVELEAAISAARATLGG